MAAKKKDSSEKKLGKKIVLNCLREMRKSALQKQIDRQQAGQQPVKKTDIYIQAISEAIDMINDMSYTGSLLPVGVGQQQPLGLFDDGNGTDLLPGEPRIIQHPSTSFPDQFSEKRFKNPI